MLTVVHDEQQPLRAQNFDERFGWAPHWRNLDAEDGRHRRTHAAWISDRSELAEPGTVREVGQQLRGSLKREPRLAHPADPGERYDMSLCESFRHSCQFAVATHKRRELGWKVPFERVQRSQPRKPRFKSGTDQLEDALGAR